jgi:two-component system LytT family response regulator
MKNLNAVIIEDNESQLSELELLLEQNHPEINLLGNAGNVADAVKLINKTKPDLVFLDIDLPGGSGFDVIEKTLVNHFKVIFTTAHQKFAVKAFEFSALHYLLKPIKEDKLKEAINRYPEEPDNDFTKKLEILKESLMEKPQRIMLPTSDGRIFVNISDIVSAKAEGNYSSINFNNKQESILISKTLKRLEELLEDMNFARPNNSHLINLKYISTYKTAGGARVILANKEEVSITKTFSETFLEKMNKFAKSIQ